MKVIELQIPQEMFKINLLFRRLSLANGVGSSAISPQDTAAGYPSLAYIGGQGKGYTEASKILVITGIKKSKCEHVMYRGITLSFQLCVKQLEEVVFHLKHWLS